MMKSAQYGAHIVLEERRLYVKDNDAFLYVPNVPVYKDENGKLFFGRRDLEGWAKFEKFKFMFEGYWKFLFTSFYFLWLSGAAVL